MHKLHPTPDALLVALRMLLPVAVVQAATQVALVTTLAGSAGVGGTPMVSARPHASATHPAWRSAQMARLRW